MVTRREVIRGAGAAALATAAGCTTTDAPVAGKPAVERPVRFGFITDCHHAPHIVRPSDPRRYGLALAKMRDFARCANRSELDFVVEGGDFKDLGRTPAESLKYLDEMEAAFAGFEGPRYHVLGNHDLFHHWREPSFDRAMLEKALREAGVRRVNLSIDTLDAETIRTARILADIFPASVPRRENSSSSSSFPGYRPKSSTVCRYSPNFVPSSKVTQ